MSNATKVVHQQVKIMTLLKTFANERGYVKGLDIESLARHTGITPHDVTKTLWGLQKRNLVGFAERKGSQGRSIPYRFRVKKAGYTATDEQVQQAVPVEKEEEFIETEVEFRTQDPVVAELLSGERIIVRPTPKNYLKDLVNRETDLRFAATILGDYGLEELGLQVLENVRLKDEELKQLREFLEL